MNDPFWPELDESLCDLAGELHDLLLTKRLFLFLYRTSNLLSQWALIHLLQNETDILDSLWPSVIQFEKIIEKLDVFLWFDVLMDEILHLYGPMRIFHQLIRVILRRNLIIVLRLVVVIDCLALIVGFTNFPIS